MIYTTKEYAELFFSGKKCERTIRRLANSGKLPANHRVKRTERCIMIEIQGIDDGLNDYFNASVEFHNRKKRENVLTLYELAAEIVVKYDISMTKFTKMHGL